jgi:hypothetical protein
MQLVQVTAPPGVAAGQPIQVEVSGARYQVAVPPGVQPGQVFAVQIPIAPAPQAVPQAMPQAVPQAPVIQQQQQQQRRQQQPMMQSQQPMMMQPQQQQVHHVHHQQPVMMGGPMVVGGPMYGHHHHGGVGMGLAGGMVAGMMVGKMMDGGFGKYGGDGGFECVGCQLYSLGQCHRLQSLSFPSCSSLATPPAALHPARYSCHCLRCALRQLVAHVVILPSGLPARAPSLTVSPFSSVQRWI